MVEFGRMPLSERLRRTVLTAVREWIRDDRRKQMDSHILVTFWGVRGSITSPGLHTAVFGGNTSCVSVETEDHIVILDAGSGIRELGQYLMKKTPRQAISG